MTQPTQPGVNFTCYCGATLNLPTMADMTRPMVKAMDEFLYEHMRDTCKHVCSVALEWLTEMNTGVCLHYNLERGSYNLIQIMRKNMRPWQIHEMRRMNAQVRHDYRDTFGISIVEIDDETVRRILNL